MSDATLTARWILPASGPPLPHGTVTYADDKIVSVDPGGVRTADVDLGNVAIVPGLVNAHTHLDLTGARGQIPPTNPDHFCDWLRGVIAYRKTRSEQETIDDCYDGLDECLRYGTTLIGDITSGGLSWHAASSAPIRSVLFWEIIGLSEERYQSVARESAIRTGDTWGDETTPPATFPGNRTLRWCLSPHSPYSVNHQSALAQLWMGWSAIHFAESPAEKDLLESHTGPFVDFLREMGVWNPGAISLRWEHFSLSHESRKSQGHPRLFIHCNYLPPDFPFTSAHSVVYCPRTHAAFGHPSHPFRGFLARGVRVCLGTDSLASNPDLDILAEARFVHEKYPDFPGDVLLKMITLTGAEALGWADEVGSLEAGKSADLVAVPLPDRDAADPHALLFAPDAPSTPRRTLFRGQWRR